MRDVLITTAQSELHPQRAGALLRARSELAGLESGAVGFSGISKDSLRML
jgi:hypothetical protein